MEEILLNDIDFEVNLEALLEKINIESGSERSKRVEEIVNEAIEVAKPKALYSIAYIDNQGEDSVTVGEVEFSSRVLSVNLDSAGRIFPFVATCGQELEEWSEQYDDILESYWVDVIKEMALGVARDRLEEHISEHNNPGPMSKMNPGSLPDWPISEQKKLFKLLEDSEDKIGVKLSNSFLMQPVKSTSGIYFPKESSFENCQLCPRKECPSRKAPYDEDLYEERYKK
jgi:hypothetical protein